MSRLETDRGNRNLYSLLDVPQGTSEVGIRAAIEAARGQANRLSRIPSRRAEAQARLTQLEQAERELLEPSARAAYDARLAAEQNTGPQQEPSPGPSTDAAPKSTNEPARTPEHCRSCGTVRAANASFCDECGISVQSSPSADSAHVAEPATHANSGQPTSASPVRDSTPDFATLDKKAGKGQGRLWMVALVIVVIAAAVFLYFHKMRQAPPVPVAPVSQPVIGQVADLRPPQASLLNHPVLQPSPAASLNQQNIHGTVTLKSDNNALSLVYPGGAEFRLSQSLYNASGPASAAFNSDYGTIALTSNGFAGAQGGASSTWQVKFQADQAKDINGDGFPEVVLSDFSGGAHCCTTVAVLSLRPQGAYLVFEQELGSAGVEFRDIDGDGRREILFHSLTEYALGSFAQGTYGVSVTYSAGGDGVYRINTRAYPQFLAHEYRAAMDDYAKAKYDSDTGNMEEDRDLIDLFFSAYLTGNRTDAYSYLGRLKPLKADASGGQDPLAILENTLKRIAPEVLKDPEWISLRSGEQAGAAPRSADPSASSGSSVAARPAANTPAAGVATPAPLQKATPSSGTLHYAGPPIEYGQTITFSGLPRERLRFTFDHDAWQPLISRQPDETQTLVLRSLKRTPQTQCDVEWSVIVN